MTTGHVAKTIKGEFIPGTWRSVCSCGWQSRLMGAPGARAAAAAVRWEHVEASARDEDDARS